MTTLIRFVSIALLLFSVVAVSTTTAAPAVGTAKARGDYSPGAYWGRSGGRSIRHARDYSRGYRWYARRAPSITPQIARQEAAGIGQNITTAQRHFGELRKATTDPETLASLTVIDKLLVDAAKAHARMDEMCKRDTIDAAGTMTCCEEIDATLAKAKAEHDRLMKHLGVEPVAPATTK